MLPICHACRLESQPAWRRWLVEGLWADQAVGIIGGEPKCCKSFMALSLGVAVASGKPCLGRFAVPRPGEVLLYPAEDALSIVRRRLVGITAHQGIDFEALPFWVITAPRFQLDVEVDRAALDETITRLRPKLLILDPFVRLHSADENASGEVARLLQHLRYLQRTHELAVALVHHTKKGASSKRPGQALRGSSELHAWPDSSLYLSRRADSSSEIQLTVEHRAEPSCEPLSLRLVSEGDAAHLEMISPAAALRAAASAEERVLRVFAATSGQLRVRTLRERAGLRHKTVSRAIGALVQRGIVERTEEGYRLVGAEPLTRGADEAVP